MEKEGIIKRSDFWGTSLISDSLSETNQAYKKGHVFCGVRAIVPLSIPRRSYGPIRASRFWIPPTAGFYTLLPAERAQLPRKSICCSLLLARNGPKRSKVERASRRGGPSKLDQLKYLVSVFRTRNKKMVPRLANYSYETSIVRSNANPRFLFFLFSTSDSLDEHSRQVRDTFVHFLLAFRSRVERIRDESGPAVVRFSFRDTEGTTDVKRLISSSVKISRRRCIAAAINRNDCRDVCPGPRSFDRALTRDRLLLLPYSARPLTIVTSKRRRISAWICRDRLISLDAFTVPL